MRARRLLAQLHGLIGAVVALFVFLVSLTGAALAFDAEIFRSRARPPCRLSRRPYIPV